MCVCVCVCVAHRGGGSGGALPQLFTGYSTLFCLLGLFLWCECSTLWLAAIVMQSRASPHIYIHYWVCLSGGETPGFCVFGFDTTWKDLNNAELLLLLLLLLFLSKLLTNSRVQSVIIVLVWFVDKTGVILDFWNTDLCFKTIFWQNNWLIYKN